MREASADDPPTGILDALLARCAGGDQVAFRDLYDLSSARLYAVALRITRQPALAADAVHDALLQVWQRADRFDRARGSAETWLLSLVRYRALDIVRRQGREIVGTELPDHADDTPDQLARLVQDHAATALKHCLDGLQADKRQLLVLAFLDGLSHVELATRIKAPLGTVKSWIRRALQDLRRCMEP